MSNLGDKYRIENNRIVGASGEPIPDDEPLFILRAQDMLMVKAIGYIKAMCHMNNCPQEHIDGLAQRMSEFNKFYDDHKDRMKLPGTTKSKGAVAPMSIADIPRWIESPPPDRFAAATTNILTPPVVENQGNVAGPDQLKKNNPS